MDKLRLDASFQIRRKQYTDEGFLDVYGVVAQTGILKYKRKDGSVRRELVTPEALKSSIETTKSAPTTLEHPPNGRVDAENARYLGRGHVVDVGYDDSSGELRVKLRVEDADTIERIEAGEKIELSPGYDVVLDETPGEHPEYGRYDAKQVERNVNHVAITGAARGGKDTSLKLDSKQMEELEERLDNQAERLDGMDEKLDAVIDALKSMKSDAGDEDPPREDEGDEPREDAISKEDVNAYADERFDILATIDKLDADIDAEGRSNSELRRAVVRSQRPENTRVDSASDEYVAGIFDEIADKLADDDREASKREDSKDPFTAVSIQNRRKRTDARESQRDEPEFIRNPNDAFFNSRAGN